MLINHKLNLIGYTNVPLVDTGCWQEILDFPSPSSVWHARLQAYICARTYTCTVRKCVHHLSVSKVSSIQSYHFTGNPPLMITIMITILLNYTNTFRMGNWCYNRLHYTDHKELIMDFFLLCGDVYFFL